MRGFWIPLLTFLLACSISFDIYMLTTIIIVTPATHGGQPVDSEGRPLWHYVYDPGEAGITVDWGDPPWEVDAPPDAAEPPLDWFEWLDWFDPCKE